MNRHQHHSTHSMSSSLLFNGSCNWKVEKSFLPDCSYNHITCWAVGVKLQIDFNMSLPESVEEAFYTVRRLIFEDFDAAFHLWTRNKLLALRSQLWSEIVKRMWLYSRRFWMTLRKPRQDARSRKGWWPRPSPAGRKTPSPHWWIGCGIPWKHHNAGNAHVNIKSKNCSRSNNAGRHSRCFQHDFTHSRHCA